MTTVNNNNFDVGILGGEGMLIHSSVPVNNTTAPFHQGDLTYMSSGIAKPLDTDAHAANLIGVALAPTAVSSNLDNSTAPAVQSAPIGYGGIWNFKTIAADTYSDNDPVYVVPSTSGGDAQTVTKNSASGSHAVGCVRLPSGQSSIAGGTNVTVPVQVYSRTYVTFAL